MMEGINMSALNNNVLYDIVANSYDESYDHQVFQTEDRIINKMIKPLLESPGMILDVGCGTGYLLDHFSIRPDVYTGIDISKNMLNIAHKKYPSHAFYKIDMMDISDYDWKFDTIIGLYSLNYARNIYSTIEGLNNCLNKGGKFLFILCGLKYNKRPLYIMNRNGIQSNIKGIGKAAIMRLFAPMSKNLSLIGLNIYADHVPEFIVPYYLPIESIFTRKFWINKCNYIIVSGRKE